MNLPSTFTANIQHAFGEKGKLFLGELPKRIETASRQWGLTDVTPVPDLSYNYVAFAIRPERSEERSARRAQSKGAQQVVLKIGVPHRELQSEVAALKYFNGDGVVNLLDYDSEHSMFLLERLKPGRMLSTLDDDDKCTEIAVDLMLKLWKPLESDSLLSEMQKHAPAEYLASGLQSFIKFTDWFDELKNLRPMFGGGTRPFPEKLIARVEETLPRLYAESSPPRLIHGDFHHFNILSSERGWLAIDPKGVIGHPEYEVGPLMVNPWPGFLNGTNPKVQAQRRLDILSEQLGFPRKRLLDWAVCFAVLSAWWDTKPDGSGGEYSLRGAELLASL